MYPVLGVGIGIVLVSFYTIYTHSAYNEHTVGILCEFSCLITKTAQG